MRLKFHKLFGLLLLSILLLSAGIVVDVCAQQDPVEADKVSAQVVSAAHIKSESFVYSPKGRRDPFKPLIEKKPIIAEKVSGRPEKVKGPLEKFELNQYRLIALMVVKGTPTAMVKAPDGKSYTVKVGEYIGMNDGRVKNIETKIIDIDENGLRVEKSPDRIVVEEIGIDSYTGKKVKENRFIVM